VVGTPESNVAERLRKTTEPEGAVPVTSNDSSPGINAALIVMPPVADAGASDEACCALAPKATIKVMAAKGMKERATILIVDREPIRQAAVSLL
jgi:hypothetical protein